MTNCPVRTTPMTSCPMITPTMARCPTRTPTMARCPTRTPTMARCPVRTPTIARCSTRNTLLVVVSLLMLVLCLPSAVEGIVSCGSCEKGSSLTCPNSFNMQFEVSFYGVQSLHLKCDYSTIELDFSMLKGCDFPFINSVKIEQCPLFNESLASVLNKIGVHSNMIKKLYWQTSHSTEEGLQKWHLENLPNVTHLEIQDNYFQSIPNEFLKNVPLLRALYLSRNNINELPKDFLSYTPEITILDLGNNQLKNISETLLENVPALQHLNLWINQLTNIPARFLSNNLFLTQVTFNSNRLTSLHPKLFQNLTELIAVDVSDNKLETLPELIFQGCSKLTDVTIQYNSLSYLPSNLFQETALSVLNLGFNQLTNMSGALRNLPTLQNVTLHKNIFKELDADMFQGSPNIVFLDLQEQENGIEKIGEGIFHRLSQLRVVILASNSLDALPAALFRHCISLMRVFMQNNRLTTLPMDTFPRDSYITKLNLSNNNLTLTEDIVNPLNTLTRIEELYLADNRIPVIFNDARVVFTVLQILDLQNNSINSLSDTDLNFVSSKVTLSLQRNNISNFNTPRPIVLGQDKELNIYLAGNPINCDCNMYYFLTAAQMEPLPDENTFTLTVRDAEKTVCAAPKRIANRPLSAVDKDKFVCEIKCSSECTCDFRPVDRFMLIDCANLGLSNPPNLTDSFKSRNELNLSLNLSNNNLSSVQFLQNPEYKRLVNLNLPNNSIAAINETYLPDGLKYMNLRYNNFTMMSQDLVDRLNASGMNLHLGGNPWSCDCGLKSFHEFIRNNYELVLDRQDVICSDGGAPVDELTTEQLCSYYSRPGTLAGIAVGAVVLLLVTMLLTAAWYRYKEMIKVWLYSHNMCLWAVTEHEIDADKKYDVFISYSYKDENFVNKILVPKLENGDPAYQVCLHYRDWIPGEFIQDQILKSVRESRRTIIVLSKNFLEGVWTQLEFKAANSQALKDKTNRIIVIVHGEVPTADELDGELKQYVHTNTYIKWGDQRFWERLMYAMPHAKYVRRRNAKVADKLEMVKPAPKSATKTLSD